MKNSRFEIIDNESKKLLSQINELIAHFESGSYDNTLLKSVFLAKEDLKLFRNGLAWNRGTEFLESDLNWTNILDDLNHRLDLIIESIE